jgi:2-polyprenyl-3-methyl-5-hydroxy-6-metoxy-1,4-benzoquinol methylase
MNIDRANDAKIVDSWHKNAAPWTVAVRNLQIESRQLITDQAIVEAILSRSPQSVLDLGCGEGWLSRSLTARGIQSIGTDAIPALIEQAQELGGGNFRTISYEEIAAGQLQISVDAIVCNFSLFGKESVEQLFQKIPSLLRPAGSLIVQTLHPLVAGGDQPEQDGWRAGSWQGFNADFIEPAPWYFRSLDSWLQLFKKNKLQLIEMREPRHPRTQQPASIIFVAEPQTTVSTALDIEPGRFCN